MNTKQLWTKTLPLRLLLLASTSASCVTVMERTFCSVKGRITNGAVCSHLIGKGYFLLDEEEYIDFLEPQNERTCVPVGYWKDETRQEWIMQTDVCSSDQKEGERRLLPKRGGGFAMSTVDLGGLKTEHEILCREEKNKCGYDTKNANNATPTPSPAITVEPTKDPMVR